MKNSLGFFLFLSVLGMPSVHAAKPSIALVYQGPGSCAGEDDCSGAAAEVARRAGMEIRYVTPETLKPEVFENASVWVQPGGNAITVVETLGQTKISWIRDFVRRGGGYLGFCAGMFLADFIVDDFGKVKGLGIIPLETADYKGDRGKDGTIVKLFWRGRSRSVFFNQGGFLKRDHTQTNSSFRLTSRYSTGEAASIETTFGKGRVAVAGFHPEATDAWKSFAAGKDSDGSDLDLAGEMLNWILSAKH